MRQENGPDRQGLDKWMTAAALGGILLFFCWFVFTNYYIRASSDPHNWLKYAHNFRSEVLQSRWPFGFALFLRLLLPVTGPYYIFLANAPVLMLMLVLVWMLGSMPGAGKVPARSSRTRYAGVAAMALALSANARDMIHYVNPYRDPLSYVLLLASVWLFARALAARRPLRLFLPGVLLGLACSVREPSILMIVPLLLYGMVEWSRSRGAVPFWKSSLTFAAGFTLALVPLAVQTYLATSQILLPPQAAMQASVVPGARFQWDLFRDVTTGAWRHYTQQIWIPILAFIGLLAAARDRQRILLLLIVPAAVIYFLFYSFYWTFTPRYFYISTLMFCLLGGYGIGWMLDGSRRLLPAAWGHRAAWAVLLALCVLSCGYLERVQAPRRSPQVSDARAFAKDLAPLLPRNAVVFSQRNLCELIQVVVLRESYAWAFEPNMILRHVEDLSNAGRPVYTMEEPHPLFPYGDTIHLRRLYGLVPIRTFDPAHYNLVGFAVRPFTLHKLRPSTVRHVSTEVRLPPDASGRGWLALDPGYLAALAPERSHVSITLNGNPLADATTWQGAQILELDERLVREAQGHLRIDMDSDGILPPEIRAAAGALDSPMDLDFDLHATFDHRWRWQGGILLPDLVYRKPRLQDEASIVIPTPAPQAGTIVMEWMLCNTSRKPGMHEDVHIWEGDVLLGTVRLPRDHLIHPFLFDLPPNPETRERRIRIVRGAPEPGFSFPGLEIHRLLLHRAGTQRAVDVRVGSFADALYIGKGFYHREDTGSPQAFRWTDGQAELRLAVAPPDAGMMLRIHYSVEHTPPALRPMPMTVQWNGAALSPAEVRTEGTETIWTGHIPAAAVLPDNRVMLETLPWSPAQQGSPDTRRLGVMLRRIEWKPIEPLSAFLP